MSETVLPSIADRIGRIEAECRGVWSLFHVTAWERARLEEWKNLTRLSENQLEVLRQIEEKVFGRG